MDSKCLAASSENITVVEMWCYKFCPIWHSEDTCKCFDYFSIYKINMKHLKLSPLSTVMQLCIMHMGCPHLFQYPSCPTCWNVAIFHLLPWCCSSATHLVFNQMEQMLQFLAKLHNITEVQILYTICH